jgi:hypothetical protein
MIKNFNYKSQLFFKYICYKVGKIFIDRYQNFDDGSFLFSNENIVTDPWIFHNEKWDRVINRWEHRRQVQKGKVPSVNDNTQIKNKTFLRYQYDSFNILKKTKTNDEWIYLNLDPLEFIWDNYRWKFKFNLKTHFHELQFGFRYKDFYNRYRFRFQDGNVFFDEVSNGYFFNEIETKKFELELDRWYTIIIDVFKNTFYLTVDGKKIFSIKDLKNTFESGSIAIILWEKDGKTDIAIDIDKITVNKLYECSSGSQI